MSTTIRNGAVDMLKLIAVLAMVIDHSRFFFPEYRNVLVTIGRLAFPIFAFVVAFNLSNAYKSGRDDIIDKYAINLAIFAVISEIPHEMLLRINSDIELMNIMFTLFAGLVVTILYASENKLYLRGVVLPTFLLCLAVYQDGFEYGILGIMIVPSMFLMMQTESTLKKTMFLLVGIVLAVLCNLQYMKVVIGFYGLFNSFTTPLIISSAFALVLCFMVTQFKMINIKAPKMGKWMYWFYPVHMLFIALALKL